jgi:hypothetical protein
MGRKSIGTSSPEEQDVLRRHYLEGTQQKQYCVYGHQTGSDDRCSSPIRRLIRPHCWHRRMSCGCAAATSPLSTAAGDGRSHRVRAGPGGWTQPPGPGRTPAGSASGRRRVQGLPGRAAGPAPVAGSPLRGTAESRGSRHLFHHVFRHRLLARTCRSYVCECSGVRHGGPRPAPPHAGSRTAPSIAPALRDPFPRRHLRPLCAARLRTRVARPLRAALARAHPVIH